MRDVSKYPPPSELLYHDPPMVLIDRFVSWLDDGAGVRCEVDILKDAMFADSKGVPSWVGIEYMAQTIGVYAGAHQFDEGLPPRIGFLLGSQNISLCCERFEFGTTLAVEARLTWNGGRVVQFDCAVFVKGLAEPMLQGCLNCLSPAENEVARGEY